MSEKLTIHKIIGDDKNLAIYKDILRWNIQKVLELKGNFGQEFKFTELGKWLVDHHRPFIDEYADSQKTPKSYRLHVKRNYIQGRIDDLIGMSLIKKKGIVKAEKNNSNIPLYQFTLGGDIVSCFLIAIKRPQNLQNLNQSNASALAIRLLCAFLKHYEASTFLFFLKFIIRWEETGKYDNNRFIHILWNIFSYLYPSEELNVRMARLIVMCIPTLYPEVENLFFQTMDDLDEQTRRLLLFQFKADIELDYYYAYEPQSKNVREWELMRLQNIQDYSKVTLSGHCQACNMFYPFVMDIYKFITLPNILAVEIGVDPETMQEEEVSSLVQKIDCEKCGIRECLLIIPNWYSVRGIYSFVTTWYATKTPKELIKKN